MVGVVRNFVLTGAVVRYKEQGIEINHPFDLDVDIRCWDDFMKLMSNETWKDKFFYVVAQMMQDRFGNDSLYGHEPDGTTAMKVEAAGLNSRLICVEQSSGRIIIMAHVEKHKSRQKAKTRKTEGIYSAIAKRKYSER